MITEYDKQGITSGQDKIISTVNNNVARIDAHAMELAEVKEDFNITNFMVCINYLCNIGELTSLEAKSVHDMMASPDTENHFMARMVITKKLEKIDYPNIRMNIQGMRWDDKQIVTVSNDPNFFKV